MWRSVSLSGVGDKQPQEEVRGAGYERLNLGTSSSTERMQPDKAGRTERGWMELRPGTCAPFTLTPAKLRTQPTRAGRGGGARAKVLADWTRGAHGGAGPAPQGQLEGPFERRDRPRGPQRPEARGRRWQRSNGDRGRQPTSPGPGPSARPASGRSPACEPGRGGREGQPRGCAGRREAVVRFCPLLVSSS